ncbi:MAG: AAA family ATPase [Bacteroidales bacterium]|nr:AAA family ATPase [Bacteroidales bacterium]
MIKLKIDNFGPIKHAELDFKKVNILIGQQGAGKSCVLKIAAFCMWVEKVYLSGEIDDLQRGISQREFVEKHLLEFYKLDEYAVVSDNKYSTISFNDNDNIKIFIDFKAADDNWMNIVEIEKPTAQKRVAYIPAERCLVSAIPNLLEIRLNDTCILNYLVDWEHGHKYYTEKNRLDILGLNAEFFYDPGSRTDYLLIKDHGVSKVIRLSNAASGFQSVVPICVLTKFYLENDDTISVREKITNSRNNLSAHNRDCTLFIEEPEENLFPETQYRLVKWLMSELDNGYYNSLFMTTHSPYILTILNNFIQAAKVGNKFPDKINDLLKKEYWLPSDNVAAYYLTNGNLQNIIDTELGEIDPELIDEISKTINHEYGLMRNIEYGIEED